MRDDRSGFCSLTTPFEASVGPVWQEYPRPQMKRDSYFPLCGYWDLSMRISDGISDEAAIGSIYVPFCMESRLSGITRIPKRFGCLVYRREFRLPDGFIKGRLLLHFGAVDQQARVLVNDVEVGSHIGGYTPFTLDITDAANEGNNTICVEVLDSINPNMGYGKQSRKRGGMWYTPVTGIWQPVWIESVPEYYFEAIKLTPTLDSITIETKGGKEQKTVCIMTPQGELKRTYSGDSATIELPSPVNWTPEAPYLYEFTLTDGNDRIDSYFALRTVSIRAINGRSYICLNDKPYFFHGVLDQGYFSDGIYTPCTSEGYEWDIVTMKRMGFNMLRKHAKVEPELFYYLCDKYGMIVFQDMVNSGSYSFVRDTMLPTLGIRRRNRFKATDERRRLFALECSETIAALYNHPSVCYYTIFNEGWGQFDTDFVYQSLQLTDPTRIWDASSGWFKENLSDVVSEHVYFRKIRLRAQPKRPLVLSEFGGYSCNIEGHRFNPKKSYGYRVCKTCEELMSDLYELYTEQVIPSIKGEGLCAAVLTQLSDVEDETNGLVTYDRQVIKVDEVRMVALAKAIKAEFNSIFE